MAKPFLTYEQQIDKLVVEKNLIVENREYAISILKKVGYFALICGYKDPFKNPTTKKILMVHRLGILLSCICLTSI